MLVGSHEHINRARWFRKMFGGGWRQSGQLAVQADYAVTHHFPRLSYTHALAKHLAKGLHEIGCEIFIPVETSMVFFDASPIGVTLQAVKDAAEERGIKVGSNRLVVHHQTAPLAVEELIDVVRGLKETSAGAPTREKLHLGH